MIKHLARHMKSDSQKFIYLLLLPLLCIVFILLHTNQSSSQSMASILLLLSPIALLHRKALVVISEDSKLRAMLVLTLSYLIYNFFVLTQHDFDELALSSFRGLFFWALLPASLIILFLAKPPIWVISALFCIAAIGSIYPMIMDVFDNTRRGQSSVHAIFWGCIALSSALIAFTLRKSFPAKWFHILGYTGLIFGLASSFWSLSRGGWISIPFSLILLYATKAITKKHIAGFIAILSLFVIYFPHVQDRIERTVQKIQIDWDNFAIQFDTSTTDRLNMWQTSKTLIEEKPILGHGFGAYHEYALSLDHVKDYKMAHNEYIHVLINGGTVGLALLLSILVTLACIFRSFEDGSKFKTAGYLLLLQYSIFSITEIFLSTKVPIVYFCLSASLIIYAGITEKSARNDPLTKRS